MLKKYVDLIFKTILSQNAKNNIDAIPHSDIFFKDMNVTHGIETNFVKILLDILKESHKILIIEIAKEDENKKIPSIEGYIDADLSSIRKLKIVFQKALVNEYEEQYNKRIMVHKIIREIFPQMNRLNNSPIGMLANKAIMLEEYEMLLEKEYGQYTETWKQEKLNELLEKNKDVVLKEKPDRKKTDDEKKALESVQTKQKKGKAIPKRAVDSKEFNAYSDEISSFSINRMLSLYGINFFYRVNLRNYKFSFIQRAIETGGIARKSDLILLKNMIEKIKRNIDNDSKIQENIQEIHRLERAISRAMIFGK